MLPHLNDFLKKLKNDDYSPETIYNYKRDLNTFDNYLVNNLNISLEEVDRNAIEYFKKYLLSPNRLTSDKSTTLKFLSISSINRIFSSLKSYFKYLSDNNIKTRISFADIKLAKSQKKYIQRPKPNMIIDLIEAPDKFEKDLIIKFRNRAMLEVLFATSISISELLSLRIDQFDISGKIQIFSKGKRERCIYLTPRSIKHLQDYLNIRSDKVPFMFIPYRGRNNQADNKKISTNYLQYKIKYYRELLGINIPISAHSLRHGFISYFIENSADPKPIKATFNHQYLNINVDYCNILNND